MMNLRLTNLKPSIPALPSSKPRTPPPISMSSLAGDIPSPSPSPAGKVRRLVLTGEERTKLDARSDRDFYAYPRFVAHVDDGFIATLTELYRQRLRPEFEVMDLMSSWISHLPPEVKYRRVVGHGLNAAELSKNPRLDYFFVKDLNEDQKLECEDSAFDAVLCTVSIQYLQQPEKVFAEVFRILKPGGLFIVSFSNRMFYEKAIAAWVDGNDYSHIQLVKQYFQSVEGFTEPEVIKKSPTVPNFGGDKGGELAFGWTMGLLGLAPASDPFFAVISHKNFKPSYE